MTKTIEITNIVPTAETEGTIDATEKYSSKLVELTGVMPELESRPEIAEAGKQLIEEYELEPTLFDDEGRMIVFTSLATRLADLKEGTSPDSDAEKEFVENTLALLAHDHSEFFADSSTELQSDSGEYDDATRKLIYERYTDTRLSADIKDAIKHGLLEDVKTRLKISPENEDAYTIKVLSIGSQLQTFGLEAPQLDYDLLDYKKVEDRQKADDIADLRNDVFEWKTELAERGKVFAQELGKDELFADAWVTTIEGVQNLCISSALAEKLLDPELAKSSTYYSEADAARDKATLEHEYTHTQGGVNVDKDVYFGINIEELRAESFSGNKLGYQDIKAFSRDYEVITGQNITEELLSRTKGGTKAEIYGALANQVGLREVVGVLLASPKEYIENQSNHIARSAHEYLGGYDGVLQALMEAEIAKGNGSAIEERVEVFAKHQLSIVNRPGATIGLDFIVAHRKRLGLEFVTEMVAEKARQMDEAANVGVN